MHFSPADLSAPVADAHSHAVFGLGSLASVANIAVNGASLASLVGPVLLGLAALWQAWTAHRRYLDERAEKARARHAEDSTVRPPPVVASPAGTGPVAPAP